MGQIISRRGTVDDEAPKKQKNRNSSKSVFFFFCVYLYDHQCRLPQSRRYYEAWKRAQWKSRKYLRAIQRKIRRRNLGGKRHGPTRRHSLGGPRRFGAMPLRRQLFAIVCGVINGPCSPEVESAAFPALGNLQRSASWANAVFPALGKSRECSF